MLKTLATGLLTRKLARGVSRRSSNPLMRAAGVAAAGYAVSRLMGNRPKKTRAGNRPRRGGLLSRAF